MAEANPAKAFKVGQILFREKLVKYSQYEGDVTVIVVGRKWVSVKAIDGRFEARFDPETMREDTNGKGTATGYYWLSKAERDSAAALASSWAELRERFAGKFGAYPARPAHIGLAEIAQIKAILDGWRQRS